MQLRGRAIYNLLQNNQLAHSTTPVEEWQTRDYRALTEHALHNELKTLGITLNKQSLTAIALTCIGPEELTELLIPAAHPADPTKQRAYLLLFEWWRRKLPDRPTLSIFCDELDRLITLYNQRADGLEETVEQILEDLERMLDDSVDAGLPPKEAFALVNQSCAHDLEVFLYDFLIDQIENDQDLLASELLDGFFDYVTDPRWFDLLRVRLFMKSDPQKADTMLKRLVEVAVEQPQFDLLIELATLLIEHKGTPHLFYRVGLAALQCTEKEEDFRELIKISADYHREQGKETIFDALLRSRKNSTTTCAISPKDQDLDTMRAIFATRATSARASSET